MLWDRSNAYWNTRSSIHMNLSIQDKTKPQLNYKTSFALLAQIEIELKSNSKANHVLYQENLVTPYWDVKMITMWWHCRDSWCTREQSVYTGAEIATLMKKNIGNITTLRKFLHWKIVCYNTVYTRAHCLNSLCLLLPEENEQEWESPMLEHRTKWWTRALS